MRFGFIAFLITFCSTIGVSQIQNNQKLFEISREQKQKFLKTQEMLKVMAPANGWPLVKQLGNGQFAVLQDIINNRPIYFTTDNLEARFTTGVEFVQSPSGLNLPLFGDGIQVGVWDAGIVRVSHVELVGRVFNKDNQDVDDHATHVTGTIAAKGINANAKGMMPNATVIVHYGFSNDLSSMADEAANGLILSNHSYGPILGWNFENGDWRWYGGTANVDKGFGNYSARSRGIDNIAYNAPKYTMVWSAGNHRSDVGDGSHPPDGPYDCLGAPAVAKNVITVGAITGFKTYDGPESAIMSDFSSWGPTDDGRIKPDLVADGVAVFSTSSESDDAYERLQGTSMSAPNVTGSLGVVQQYYKETQGQFMNSATLKALTIHTAREAGLNKGPDYSFGWGVLNVADAIQVLSSLNESDTLLVQRPLSNGQSHNYSLFSDGKTPITATIAWTDVPGAVVDEGNQSSNLINDLDIRLVDDENNVIRSWTLDPANPGRAAVRGNNSRDNVEKIEYFSPLPRMYHLIVSHKGTLATGSQSYGLIFTGGKLNASVNDIYWIAGAGNTDLSTNWSDDSGGNELADLNLNGKTLVFDDNGSLANNQVINFTSSESINNLIWLSNKKCILDLHGNTLTVSNNLYSTNQNLIIRNGTIVIGASNINTISFNYVASTNCKIILENTTPIIIQSNLKANSLVLSGEAIQINNKTLDLGSLSIDGSTNFSVNNSIINVSQSLTTKAASIKDSETVWNFMNSNITISDQGTLKLSSINSEGSVTINGQISNTVFTLNGVLIQNGDLTSQTFSMEPGSRLHIGDNDKLIVQNKFEINSNTSDDNIIESDSENGTSTIEIAYRDLLCFDYTNVNNIDFETESVVNFGDNSTLVNVQNAVNLNCEDVIFPSFELDSYCANSAIHVINNSSGSIDAYEYDLGSGQSSNLEEPILFFDNPGEHSISLAVSNSLVSVDYTNHFNLIENDLPEVKIVENSQGLVATTIAENYVWYHDGLIVPDETSRTIVPENNGEYRVSYSKEATCPNRVSAPFKTIVTGINELDHNRMSIFPNPANTTITIQNLLKGDVVQIHSLEGKLMKNFEANGSLSQIDISDLNNGLFIVTIERRDEFVTIRLVKD